MVQSAMSRGHDMLCPSKLLRLIIASFFVSIFVGALVDSRASWETHKPFEVSRAALHDVWPSCQVKFDVGVRTCDHLQTGKLDNHILSRGGHGLKHEAPPSHPL